MDQLAVDKGLLKKLKACLDFRKAIGLEGHFGYITIFFGIRSRRDENEMRSY